jgi:hypothetical protein
VHLRLLEQITRVDVETIGKLAEGTDHDVDYSWFNPCDVGGVKARAMSRLERPPEIIPWKPWTASLAILHVLVPGGGVIVTLAIIRAARYASG